MDRVKISGSRFSLFRDRDGSGDSGQVLKSLDPQTGEQHGEIGEIVVGCCLECGSAYARTYENQDFWLTTPVTEIMEVLPQKDESGREFTIVKVQTKNSAYTIKGW